MTDLDAFERIQARINDAATAAGRQAAEITLIGVIKGQPLTRIQATLARHPTLKNLGENYLNEALEHQSALGRERYLWHYIGQIQTNKTRPIAMHFDWVHTVDRIKVVERLNAQRGFHGPPLNVCIQANLWNEASKGGASAAELPALAQAIQSANRLRLRGLMALPPETADPAQQRAQFEQLVREYDSLRNRGFELDTLSMGMSGDFESAIQSGATHLRVGSALFGSREPSA
jgi:PLP dependent protein